MLEYFLGAIKNFKTNKLRTALSLLGIVIGIMAVIVITTLSSSLYDTLVSLFKGGPGVLPENAVEIYPNWNPETNRMSIDPDEKYRATLHKLIPNITDIFYTYSHSVTVLAGSAQLASEDQSQLIQGVEQGWIEATQTDIEYGSGFTINDFANGRQRAVIGSELAEKLFPEGEAVGKNFSLVMGMVVKNSTPPTRQPRILFFEVAGILKYKNDFSGNTYNRGIYIPRSSYIKLTHEKIPSGIQVFMKSPDDYETVKPLIEKFSDEYCNAKESVYVYGITESIKKLNQVLSVIQIVLTAIAFISLFVGGINIMNIMIATVTERKKEIGIRKALGATNKDITVQFLVEAAALTMTGGIIGVAVGLSLSYLIINFIPLNSMISSDSNLQLTMHFAINIAGTVTAFVVSFLVGIFFGLKPARKAAALDPILALAG